MMRQILTLLWNRRRKLVWIYIEQLLVFAVMLFCFTSLSGTLKRYYAPGNVTFSDVAVVGYEFFDDISVDDEELNDLYTEFKATVRYFGQLSCVEYISYSSFGSVPLTGARPLNDSLDFYQKKYKASINYCDENYFRMFNFRMLQGRWLNNIEPKDGIPEVVITRKLSDQISGDSDPVGKIMHVQNRDFRIVGVMYSFKRRDVDDPDDTVFLPAYLMPENSKREYFALVQCKKGMFPDFSKEYLNHFQRSLPDNKVQPRCIELNSVRDTLNFLDFLDAYILGIPTVFMVVFAFLGTFGLTWLQTKKRFDEFGLRIAVGSTPAQLKRCVIAESIMLTSFAMIPGLIVFANLYAFASRGWEFPAAVGAAIILMWLFSAFSAWYPAKQAAKVQPVEALSANQ